MAKKEEFTPDEIRRFKEYQTAVAKERYRSVTIRLNREKDKDVIEKLEAQPVVVDYVRDLINADIERRKGAQQYGKSIHA